MKFRFTHYIYLGIGLGCATAINSNNEFNITFILPFILLSIHIYKPLKDEKLT